MFRKLFTALLTVIALVAFNAHAAVDVNQASRADLETVKGIGPAMSGKIIKARESGSFKNWNDLVERVGGIGPTSAGKLSSGGLTVAGAAYDGSAAAASKPTMKSRAGKGKAAGAASANGAAGTDVAASGATTKKTRKAAKEAAPA